MENTYASKNEDLPKMAFQSPSIFLNSNGAGICSDRSYFLYQLWNIMGYKSRIYCLDGHVVPEVFDEKWKMLDLHYNLYFTRNTSEIASVQELETNNEQYDLNFHKHPSSFLIFPSYYNKAMYRNLFTTTKNNSITKPQISNWTNIYLSLPPKSELSFPFSPDSIGYQAIGKLQIPDYYTGNIVMPFTIHRIENAYIVGAHNSGKHTNLPAGRYYISGNNCTIYFYINPLLAKSQAENIISIRKNKNLPLESTLLKSQISTKMDMLVYFRTLFPQILGDNIDFFDKLAVIKHHYNDSSLNFKNKKDFIDRIILIYQNAANASSLPNNMEQNLQTLGHFFNEGNNEMLKIEQSTNALFYITWSSAFLSENDFKYLLAEFYAIKNN